MMRQFTWQAEEAPVRVDVLDTTLRDGNYAIDFKFTAEDTAIICRGLEAAGFRFIEIGHGLGLGASHRGLTRAAATDQEYLTAARDSLTSAAFGMFCGPHIASLEDLDMAADYGMDFIRMGTDVTRVAEMRDYIARARRRGMMVTANLMKSYAVSPKEFARAAHQSYSYGAEVVYLVDSAGCMLPEDVTNYIEAVRELGDVPIGFHGHDNLGMGVYNSLLAADLGAVLVDGSLQGLGRSAGNAITEVLVAVLQKRGHRTGIDLLRTLRVGQCIDTLLQQDRIQPLDVVAGYAGFHSSFLPQVMRVADAHRIEPGQLIIELCKVTQLEAGNELLEQLAEQLTTRIEAVSATAAGRTLSTP
jgi:4-hydroxy-2-oxovalerate aldolase